MKRIKVVKNGAVTNQAEFEDPTKWLEKHITKNTFGKPERWVTADQEDVTQAIETRQVEVTPAVVDEQGQVIEPAVFVTEYKLAAEFEIVVEDLTQEIEEENRKKELKKALRQKMKALKKSEVATVNNLNDAFLDLLRLLDLKD